MNELLKRLCHETDLCFPRIYSRSEQGSMLFHLILLDAPSCTILVTGKDPNILNKLKYLEVLEGKNG